VPPSKQKFKKKYADAIHNRDGEDAFGCLVFRRINVIGEERNVSHEAPDAPEGDDLLLVEEYPDKSVERISRELK
jgi:hypothetical protein